MFKDSNKYLESILLKNNDLATKIYKANSVKKSSIEAYSYIIASLKTFHPNLDFNSLKEFIVDDENDGQIDAIVLDDNKVFVYDVKKSKGFGQSDIRVFASSVREYLMDKTKDFTSLNSGCTKLFPKVIAAIESDQDIHIRVVRGGEKIMNQENLELIKSLDYDSIKETSFYSLKELIAQKIKSEKKHYSGFWKFKIKGNATNTIIEKEESNIVTLICNLELKTLVDKYFKFDPPELMFAANIRNYQGNKKLSDKILNSLSSNTRARKFNKLHNGITIVSDKIEKTTGTDFKIYNPQVVNGCQTITTISSKFQLNRTSPKLTLGYVLCKFYSVLGKDIENICEASNTQVPIKIWSLRSNDDCQIIIENFLNNNGIKYKRKNLKLSNSNHLTIDLLGQIIYSAIHEMPADAKNKKSTMFSSITAGGAIYNKIFPKKLDLASILNVVNIWLFIKTELKRRHTKGSYHRPANMHFVAGMYFLINQKGYKLNKATFNIVDTQIKRVSKGLKSKEFPNLFTKQQGTWVDIKKKLLLKKKKM